MELRVENKQIVRHLRTLVHDLRVPKKWSDPTILSLVLFVINDAVNSETGLRPLDAKFGSADGIYFCLPENSSPSEITNACVCALDVDLQHRRAVSLEYQKSLLIKRTQDTPEPLQNCYQPGDFVLYQRNPDGRYEVIQQYKNDVESDTWSWGTLPVCM